jgi:hypothetical protein
MSILHAKLRLHFDLDLDLNSQKKGKQTMSSKITNSCRLMTVQSHDKKPFTEEKRRKVGLDALNQQNQIHRNKQLKMAGLIQTVKNYLRPYLQNQVSTPYPPLEA